MAKQPHRRGRSRGWIGYLLSFFLGVLLTFGGYTYLTQERPLSQEDFSQKVFLVDQIIQSQLYEIGILEKGYPPSSILLKKGEGIWPGKQSSHEEFRFSRTLPFSLIEGNFKRSLSHARSNRFHPFLHNQQNPFNWK